MTYHHLRLACWAPARRAAQVELANQPIRGVSLVAQGCHHTARGARGLRGGVVHRNGRAGGTVRAVDPDRFAAEEEVA